MCFPVRAGLERRQTERSCPALTELFSDQRPPGEAVVSSMADAGAFMGQESVSPYQVARVGLKAWHEGRDLSSVHCLSQHLEQSLPAMGPQ